MFTGLIQQTGIVVSKKKSSGTILEIKPEKKFEKIVEGESIAVDGCCLTVVQEKNGKLFFDVSDETVSKTIVDHYEVGSKLNLERALRLGDAFGGHFVLGHVDGVCEVVKVKKEKKELRIRLKADKKNAVYLVNKGSVTLNGISLTICNLKKNIFEVAIIPLTTEKTTIGTWNEGDKINIEFDVLSKMVANVLTKK